MTREELSETLDKIIYWVENKGPYCCSYFDSDVVYGIKEWDETVCESIEPSEKQQQAVYNIYTKFKIEKWLKLHGYKHTGTSKIRSRGGRRYLGESNFCIVCKNTGRQYYCEDVYVPCMECS